MKAAITINKKEIDTAIENAEESNKEVIDEIIDPTTGLIINKKFNIDGQSKYQTNELEKNYALSNQIQERLDDLLTKMKEKTNLINYTIQKPTEEIPNNPLSSEQPEPIDIYLEDNYYDTYDNKLIFPQLSTDDRKDFELNIAGDDLIITFKSTTLKTVNISRKELKNTLNNIINDLHANVSDFKTKSNTKATQRQVKKIKNLTEKVDKGDKQHMESRLSSENWIKKLIDNQIYLESNYYTFDEKILTISIC